MINIPHRDDLRRIRPAHVALGWVLASPFAIASVDKALALV